MKLESKTAFGNAGNEGVEGKYLDIERYMKEEVQGSFADTIIISEWYFSIGSKFKTPKYNQT